MLMSVRIQMDSPGRSGKIQKCRKSQVFTISYNFECTPDRPSANSIFTFKIAYMKKTLVKKFMERSLPVLLFISLASFAFIKFEDKTVTGEILDMKCYMSAGKHGPDHKDCAAMCLKGGSPMGILAQDGKVYLLIEGKDDAAYEEAK